MRYEIILKIDYSYAHTVSGGRHLLRVVPRSMPGMQDVRSLRLQLAPVPTSQLERRDFFGNLCQAIEYQTAHETFGVHLIADVERTCHPCGADRATPYHALGQDLAAMQDLGPDSPLHFLAASPRIRDLGPFRDFALALLRPGMTTGDVMLAVSEAIRARMVFDDEATDVDTTPHDAFTKGRGVCQDYAHIMIACLRVLGIPAAYVSGFLRTIPPPGRERLPGSDAMHAWVRIWCGCNAGWQEYDPTNALAVGNDHVLVGYGRDYADVAPIRGVSRTAGSQQGKHTVDVIPRT
ncbi:MAG: transglutaminase family protein [Proteobacteria bacterium]|nr:transglutaminase family protein [Pseudomonadota bacterium]